MNKKFMHIMSLLLAVAVFLCHSALAIMPGEGDYPWSNEATHPLDKPVKDMYPKGSFFLNLGPTGLRARINEDTPTQLLIKFVFQDDKSPARGKININDIVVGANGKLFEKPHLFGRRGEGKGWDGPLMDLSRYMEDSQGSDGKLNLLVWPGGKKDKQTTVTLDLKPVGRFSPTYPFNCSRSERMLEELCDFMVSEYERKGGNWGRIHVRSHCTLALMNSGIAKHEALTKKIVAGYADNRYSPFDGGFTTWNWGFDGILMGEHFHRYKDKSLIPAIESLIPCYDGGQINGGEVGGGGIYTHSSYPVIINSEKKPYASIAAISALGMTAMSLFKADGLPYNEAVFLELHQAFLRTSKPSAAAIAYAFSEGPKVPEEYSSRHVHVTLANPKESESGKGPGFVCPDGMKKITKYTLNWPTAADPRFKPTEWVEEEREWNIVIEHQNGDREIHRNHPKGRQVTIPEPTGPYTTTEGSRHIMPTGLGAVAHLIGSKEKSWYWFGKHCANTCANTYNDSFSGHGGGQLHGFWEVVGAANADADKQRVFLDYMKSFLILSETHNGGMIVQPWNRDRVGGNGDPFYGPRLLPTATAAMLLSIPKKLLQIMGLSTSAFGLDTANLSSGVKSAHGNYVKENYSLAWRGVMKYDSYPDLSDSDKEAIAIMKKEMTELADYAIKQIETLDRIGDVVRMKDEITTYSRQYADVGRFNEVVDPLSHSLKKDAQKAQELKNGIQYDKLMAKIEKSGSDFNYKLLDKFAQQNPDSVYGKAAAAVMAVHTQDKDQKVQRDDYFNKLKLELAK